MVPYRIWHIWFVWISSTNFCIKLLYPNSIRHQWILLRQTPLWYHGIQYICRSILEVFMKCLDSELFTFNFNKWQYCLYVGHSICSHATWKCQAAEDKDLPRIMSIKHNSQLADGVWTLAWRLRSAWCESVISYLDVKCVCLRFDPLFVSAVLNCWIHCPVWKTMYRSIQES